jgi:hypothetical protein
MRHSVPMPDDIDFRSDKSESAEGAGIAFGQWRGFHHNLDEDVIAQAFSTPNTIQLELHPEIVEELASDALERSELIGFWVAWHLAGGFQNLVHGGWHRATIYRKVHRFRAAFGAHPDEYVFPWIQLDLKSAWTEDIERRVEGSGNRGLFS